MKAITLPIGARFLVAAAFTAVCMAARLAPAGTLNAVFNSPSDVPVTANGYMATSNSVNLTLNFAPPAGTDLMLVSNTALDFIQGTFNNLAQGQLVALSYGGVTFPFVPNYYGGSGNDLVLVWANSRPFAWGRNDTGQLGNNTIGVNSLMPGPLTGTGELAGKHVVALAAGAGYSLALCSDGTVAAWGGNAYGQLGNGTTNTSLTPVAVSTQSGVSALSGKVVVAIAAGMLHSLALCSDGTVVAWGYNTSGQLGDHTVMERHYPVAVSAEAGVSALYGKTVVAIAAGGFHNLALCSDGTVAAWGSNSYGELGDNQTSQTLRNTPFAVNTNSGVSALYGKTVVAIAAGADHNLALCSEGTIAAWGRNDFGQLGDGTRTIPPDTKSVPVSVLATGALAGKTVVALAAGAFHSLALCSDGSLTSWGYNAYGQLGDNTTTLRSTPVAVNTNASVSALYGKTVVAAATSLAHSLALCSDGTLAAWGHNGYGQLGDNTTNNCVVPLAHSNTPLAPSQRFTRVFGGQSACQTLALASAPPASPFTLTGAQPWTEGAMRFTFTNTPGAFFSVLAATNLALESDNWTVLGSAVELSPGQFHFTDPQATNSPRRFYQVRSP